MVPKDLNDVGFNVQQINMSIDKHKPPCHDVGGGKICPQTFRVLSIGRSYEMGRCCG